MDRFRLTEQNYRYLFNNASDAMWVHDMDGNMLVANEACARLTGYSEAEMTGMHVLRFLGPGSLELAREVKRKLMEGSVVRQPYEQKLRRKDGSIRTVMMSTSLVISGGQAIGFQNIARDVTEEVLMQENLRFYIQQTTRAQEGERKRIARQLHDEVAPPILLLIQRLDSVASLTRPKISRSMAEKLEDLRSQAISALEGVRRCAQDLRPSILDDLGLIAALEWIAEDLTKKNGIGARVEVAGNKKELPAEVQLLLFRIAQEALSNIRRHAQASTALVKLDFGSNKLSLTVSDDGRGFELSPRADLARDGKLGVAGMYERAHLLGGALQIESAPGKGTRIVAEVPLAK